MRKVLFVRENYGKVSLEIEKKTFKRISIDRW